MSTLRIRTCMALLAAGLAGCSDAPNTVGVTSGTQFAVTGSDASLYMDLQGLLWRLPVTGGQALALTDARDDLRLPQLSPDGTTLVAQSFASGYWNLVLLDSDGSNRRALTDNTFDDQDPVWSVDGRTVLFSSDRSGNDDIWSIDIATGELTQLTDHPANDYAPAATQESLLFVSERERKPGLYRIARNSEPELLAVAPAGRLYAPRSSPDGNRVAWVQAAGRNGFPGVAVNELVLHNLATDTESILSVTGSDVFSMPPAWLDNDTLLYTADGGIRRINLADETTDTVKFTAELPLTIERDYARRVPLAFTEDEQPVLGIVDPVLLPGDDIVFTALGDLWLLRRGEVERLTDDEFVERDLSSVYGSGILTYISDRSGSMQIWVDNINQQSLQLTDDLRGPRYPLYSPDGNRIAFQEVGPIGTQDFTVRILELETGKIRRLRSSPKIWPGRMAWSADGQHIIVAELHKTGRASDGRNRLVSIDVTQDTSEVLALPEGFVPDAGPVASADGTQLALISDGKLYRLPLTADGQAAGDPVLILDALVESPDWSDSGRLLLVLTANGMELVDALSGRRMPVALPLNWRPVEGSGTQLIHAGRLWDGSGDTYINDVDIYLVDERIVAIEPHAEHPADIPVIDAAGQTVLPGLIDHHVHFEPHKGECVGRSLLAFGITTVVEPGGLPYESREHMESWLSGSRPGPRLVFAGPQLDGARRTFHFASHITSEERLERELERGDQLGYGFLKTYRRLRPELQQRTIELGHERGLPVTAHAALRNLGFGGDRTEHLRGSSRTPGSSKQSDLLVSYDDVQSIYTLTGAAVTPTIINQGGFFDIALRRGDEFADVQQYQTLFTSEYRDNLMSFTRIVERKIDLVRAGLSNAGMTLVDLDQSGALIVAGTDSPIFPYGLSLIIELQNYVDAGLGPAAALRTATSNAAMSLGAASLVGRIEAGYLADLVIIDGDPLANISDLINVEGVLVNGYYRSIAELLSSPDPD